MASYKGAGRAKECKKDWRVMGGLTKLRASGDSDYVMNCHAACTNDETYTESQSHSTMYHRVWRLEIVAPRTLSLLGMRLFCAGNGPDIEHACLRYHTGLGCTIIPKSSCVTSTPSGDAMATLHCNALRLASLYLCFMTITSAARQCNVISYGSGDNSADACNHRAPLSC